MPSDQAGDGYYGQVGLERSKLIESEKFLTNLFPLRNKTSQLQKLMVELVQHSKTVSKLVEDGRMKCKEQNGEGCNMPPDNRSSPCFTETAKIHRREMNIKRNWEPP